MVRRSYSCLNRRCQSEFDSEQDHPPCPACRGLRVQWIPKPVAIRSAQTTQTDKTVRELAADFGLSNFRSPQRDQRAKMPLHSNNGDTTVFEPQKGWRLPMPASALTGQGHAVCGPTGVTAKIKVDPNAGALKESDPRYGLGAMRAATRIEGSHRGGK